MKYTYTFDQLRKNQKGQIVMFMDYEWTKARGGVDRDNYFTADNGTIEADTPQEACEKLYRIYNADHPSGYNGRSMSVSDIINLWDNEQEPPVKTSWFCDCVGFVPLVEEQSIVDKIAAFAAIQRGGSFPCPRCGKYQMDSDPIRNALSRHATIYVCDECGKDEAIKDYFGIPIPSETWAVIIHPELFTE